MILRYDESTILAFKDNLTTQFKDYCKYCVHEIDDFSITVYCVVQLRENMQ